MFVNINLEDLVPANHAQMADEALSSMSRTFAAA
jgi:hypothetical protein